MFKYKKYLAGIAVIILILGNDILDVKAAPTITEKEIIAVISILKAKHEGRDKDVLTKMEREKISIKRLQEIITEIAMIMPHVQTERALKSVKIEQLTDAQKKTLESARKNTKEYALNYLKHHLGPKASYDKELQKRLEIYNKHAKQIKTYLSGQFVAIPCFELTVRGIPR